MVKIISKLFNTKMTYFFNNKETLYVHNLEIYDGRMRLKRSKEKHNGLCQKVAFGLVQTNRERETNKTRLCICV